MRIKSALLAVLVTAGIVIPPPAVATADPSAWVAPLSTRGRHIVDAAGDRFKLKAANWHGASGTWTGSGDVNDPAAHHAGEIAYQTPLGLDRASIDTIIDGLAELGLNSVRLPFSNAMIHDTRPVPALPANPELRGLTPLQVYDGVVARLTARGFAVILNNHTTTSRWCCGLDGNERWNTAQTEQQWQDDWLFMARRYAANKRVAGADLYNEVRRNVFDDPNWGWGNGTDWQRASQRVADRILTEANPDLLLIVEGINWTGLPVDGLPHGRPTLEPARTLSHTLVDSGKLVYAAHFYGYTGPNHSGATGTGETHDPRYRDLSPQELRAVLYRQAFFVSAETGKHYTAPLWISEFGEGRHTTDAASRAWFENFVGYLAETDTDFAYWPAVGFHEGSTGNGWSLLSWDAAGRRVDVLDGTDWRGPAWRRLVSAPSRSGRIPEAERWSMLNLDYADFQASRKVRAMADWNPGARKGACPDGQRLTGLSHTGNRGLCTGRLGVPSGYAVVRGETYVDTDWASGYTKVQCPPDHAAVGYSVTGAAFSALLCGKSTTPLGRTGRTVWFDRGDNRPSGNPGGDFASGRYKGQCAPGEYVAGVAYTGRVGSNRTPDALLCRA
ncbi:glycoside hydrolase [Amycolatopsis sp. WAC 04182]|uniref:glycoside hydrolase family 5 protein n=1 Tax=Amycolatopsis sp. WAC 04182 TaxID=2203198 RepID=UPI000F7817DB|nr:cellulase family glycosylhydrolase [Amycolatopsis sp. WAC 04182]RSN52530.1 glycoside hydrolase [Amycolatopsis sp. WAC 04182]